VPFFVCFCLFPSEYTMESKQQPSESELDEVKKKIKEAEEELKAIKASLRAKNKDIAEDEIAKGMYSF